MDGGEFARDEIPAKIDANARQAGFLVWRNGSSVVSLAAGLCGFNGV